MNVQEIGQHLDNVVYVYELFRQIGRHGRDNGDMPLLQTLVHRTPIAFILPQVRNLRNQVNAIRELDPELETNQIITAMLQEGIPSATQLANDAQFMNVTRERIDNVAEGLFELEEYTLAENPPPLRPHTNPPYIF